MNYLEDLLDARDKGQAANIKYISVDKKKDCSVLYIADRLTDIADTPTPLWTHFHEILQPADLI